MKKVLPVVLLLAGVAAVAFLAGRRTANVPAPAPETAARRVLYYVDPMNPANTSDRPGIAPCGMPLEPVYADEGGGGHGSTGAPGGVALPAGTVRISAEKQQAAGVRTGTAERKEVGRMLRLTGRVSADETRVYRISSVTEGWIRELSPATTGSFVRENQVLGAYYSQEIQGPQQAYLYALEALDRFVGSGSATDEQIEINQKNVRNARQALLNLGMGAAQLDEIARTRKVSQNIQILAPADGVLLERNLTVGQPFDRTRDLFVIADLSRVWVLADAFEGDAADIVTGGPAEAVHPVLGRRFPARVSDVPPVFDPSSRTFRVRLPVDNPGTVLRPGMFVDVELPVRAEGVLAVPVDAVLDSGSRKIVFVDRGGGYLEPRAVEIGRRFGEDVEVLEGLMAGEKIVVSGNFMVDSESRMKAALSGMTPARAKDPVCRMQVDEAGARAQGLVLELGGKTFHFCCAECKEAFSREPARYDRPASGARPAGEAAGGGPGTSAPAGGGAGQRP